MIHLILASASEARMMLLRNAGVSFGSIAADLDEAELRDQMQGQDAKSVALALAQAKASAVAARSPGALVLGADQVLSFSGALFSKPPDRAAARRQLAQLRGETHELISAAALVRDGAVIWSDTGTVKMTMRDFSDNFLDCYLDHVGDQAFSSVGAYQLEGLGAQLFERIDGDYFTVLGLPLLAVLAALRHYHVLGV